MVLVNFFCPPHLPATQTIIYPTQPHSEPKQAHPDAPFILVSNGAQPIGGIGCRPGAGERKPMGRRGRRGGHFILYCQPAADEALAGPAFCRTGGLQGQLLFQDVDSYQAPVFQCCFFLMPLQHLGWWCLLPFLVPGTSQFPIDSLYSACFPINDSFIKDPFRW